MAKTTVITDVDPSALDQVVNDFKLDGAIVTTKKQANGLFTVTARWP